MWARVDRWASGGHSGIVGNMRNCQQGGAFLFTERTEMARASIAIISLDKNEGLTSETTYYLSTYPRYPSGMS